MEQHRIDQHSSDQQGIGESGAQDSIDRVWLKKARNQFDTLYTAIRDMVYYRELRRLASDDRVTQVMLDHLRIALLGSIVINWNKLFALEKSEEAWKRLTAESAGFRTRVYSATGFDYQQWSDYRKSVREFSARLHAHFDSSHHLENQLELEPMFRVLEVAHRWMHQLYQGQEALACDDLLKADYIEQLASAVRERLREWPRLRQG
ncbi:hypothetical protein [Aestuariirhabdus litorea]|uniref:HEPN AbiU2-like domain-containing protein n=1 Tax=Aestuariirhabdus litorea TaxID=2528527 RepID=A0A3P3VMU7_9GAMM|nr:hypothetical protein [Aestuariirhabdus litorea]RRJ83228.1 hypothetical protein D0544_15455 [Aestuariirhabdus litorea]RWW93385.1 hypothetical protein DZC74_15425 [Endozoicomonadaceae bacterium GTF-13]